MDMERSSVVSVALTQCWHAIMMPPTCLYCHGCCMSYDELHTVMWKSMEKRCHLHLRGHHEENVYQLFQEVFAQTMETPHFMKKGITSLGSVLVDLSIQPRRGLCTSAAR